MLKTNVISKNYRVICMNAAGAMWVEIITAESLVAAALLRPPVPGWTLLEVTEL